MYEDGAVKRIAYMLRGKPDGAVSVDLARLTTPEEAAGRGKSGTGLGEMLVVVPRKLGFKVEYRPLVEDPSIAQKANPAHCQIEGKNTRGLCKQLAEATKVLIMPQEITSPDL